jgi:probable F420-dependent oxidoreductase
MPSPSLFVFLRNFAEGNPEGWQHLFDHAIAADRAGVDGVAVSDHVVLGERLDAHAKPELGGSAGGHLSTGSDGDWLEPLTLLSVICGQTTRIRLTTHILLAALRRPVVLAKAAATLDVLSGGRLELGVGIGWQREEYDAAGLDFSRRGRQLDQTLEVCQTLWRHSPATFETGDMRFDHIHCKPQPVQALGVPIWVSGTLNRRVLDRLVRFASGWIPWGPDAADPTAAVPVLRAALVDAGRDPSDFGIRAFLPPVDDEQRNLDRTMAQVRALVDAGITQFVGALRLPAGVAAAEDYLARLMEAFRAATDRP